MAPRSSTPSDARPRRWRACRRGPRSDAAVPVKCRPSAPLVHIEHRQDRTEVPRMVCGRSSGSTLRRRLLLRRMRREDMSTSRCLGIEEQGIEGGQRREATDDAQQLQYLRAISIRHRLLKQPTDRAPDLVRRQVAAIEVKLELTERLPIKRLMAGAVLILRTHHPTGWLRDPRWSIAPGRRPQVTPIRPSRSILGSRDLHLGSSHR